MTLSDGELNALAKNGIIEWGEAVIRQAGEITAAFNQKMAGSQLGIIRLHIAEHFFAIAAHRLFQFVDFARERGFIGSEDFMEMEGFRRDAKEIRDMREHVIEYWQGGGRLQDRFTYIDPDAMEAWGRELATLASQSTFVGGVYKLGGRLDVHALARVVSKALTMFQ